MFQPADSVDAWTSFIPKGAQFEFNDILWGATTQHYLTPIQELSDSQFDLVVKEAHLYVKTARSVSGSFGTGDDDFDDLFTFRWWSPLGLHFPLRCLIALSTGHVYHFYARVFMHFSFFFIRPGRFLWLALNWLFVSNWLILPMPYFSFFHKVTWVH